MFSTADTIVAIATPPGRGGIGVVRVSGPDAHRIARALITHPGQLAARHATLTRVRFAPDTSRIETIPHAASAAESSIATSVRAIPPPAAASCAGATRADAIDQVVATYFPAPHSYTGDDVVELSAHGSPVVLRTIVAAALACGARPAEPGEFTLRAFLNGRIDLMQAEAIADLIDAVTPLQARTAFDQLDGTLTRVVAEIDLALFDLVARLEASVDFPDEGYHFLEPAALVGALDAVSTRTAALLAGARRGRLVREGLQIAIVGKPNVGKSSVFNALAGAARAIVTEVPGTTRDLVTEVVDLDGLRVTLVDTAGLRETADVVEAEGVSRAKQALAIADLVLVVVDRSEALGDDDRAIVAQATDYKALIVCNKSDLPDAWIDAETISVSALSGAGMDTLRQRIRSALDLDRDLARERPEITNVRHIALVQRAHDALARARQAADASGGALSEEFVLADLQDARTALEEITGRRAAEDVLAHIFTRFCVGK